MVHSGVYTLLSIIEILFCCTDESNVVSGLDPSKSKAAPPEVCSAMHFGQPQTTLHEAAGKVKYLQSFLKEISILGRMRFGPYQGDAKEYTNSLR